MAKSPEHRANPISPNRLRALGIDGVGATAGWPVGAITVWASIESSSAFKNEDVVVASGAERTYWTSTNAFFGRLTMIHRPSLQESSWALVVRRIVESRK